MITADLETKTHDIVVEQLFPHHIDVVWRVLTSGELMARWVMPPTGFAPVVGNEFTYQTTPAGAWDGKIRCTVLEVVQGKRFAYRWQGGDAGNVGYGSLLDTVVTFTLSQTEAGTRLTVVHSGFRVPDNEVAYTNMSKGWNTVIQRMADVATDEDG